MAIALASEKLPARAVGGPPLLVPVRLDPGRMLATVVLVPATAERGLPGDRQRPAEESSRRKAAAYVGTTGSKS